MPGKTMLFREVGGVLLCVHNAEAPAKDEWEAYVEYCRQLPRSVNKTAVVTGGGAPDAAQRKALNERYLDIQKRHNKEYRVAVLTDSSFVRGAVKALALFNQYTDAFPYANGSGVPAALQHLGIQGVAAGQIALELEKMRRELGMK